MEREEVELAPPQGSDIPTKPFRDARDKGECAMSS